MVDTGWLAKPITMECSFTDVDPDVLALLTGGLMGTLQPRTFALEVIQQIPVRRRAWRVVWEWLTRTPRQYTQHVTYVPHATMAERQDDD